MFLTIRQNIDAALINAFIAATVRVPIMKGNKIIGYRYVRA